MPISFSCGQCGKDYVVSDALGGKRAVCKACGNRMTIPGEAVTATAPVSAAAPQAARPSPRPAPAYEPPVGDVYGFDEAPSALPPLMPRTGGPTAEEDSAGSVPKKKKKKGFFSSSKKKSSGSSFPFSGVGVGGFRAIGVVVFLVVMVLGRMGLSSKTDIKKVYQTLVNKANQAATILEPVHDVQSARTVSPKIKAQIAGIIKLLEDNKHMKGRVNEINEVTAEYQQKVYDAFFNLGKQVGRCRMIPGVQAALDIEGDMLRMTNILEELGKQNPN